jgi:hypothetical protein
MIGADAKDSAGRGRNLEMPGYRKPGVFVARVVNPLIGQLIKRFGLERTGMQVMRVTGRTSGKHYEAPVFPLEYAGKLYLVAPRGETQWVRNAKARGQVSLGRKGRFTPYLVTEIGDASKPPILKAYLERYEGSTKPLFGLGKEASLDELAGIAPNHPVFELEPMKIA